VAKRARIESDGLGNILLICVNVRCRDVSSSYRLSSRRFASSVGVECCGV
jgi:hypothetical protein